MLRITNKTAITQTRITAIYTGAAALCTMLQAYPESSSIELPVMLLSEPTTSSLSQNSHKKDGKLLNMLSPILETPEDIASDTVCVIFSSTPGLIKLS